MTYRRKSILITGASTGLGRQTTLTLAQSDWHVFATARTQKDLDQLAAIPNVTPVELDVTKPEQITKAVEYLKSKVDGLDALINNAGICVSAPLECVPMGDLRTQFEVNVFGVVALTQAFLPLVRTYRGRIILIGSAAGRIALPFLGPYAASKFALEAIADSLRREVSEQGMHVSLLQVGSIVTPIWDKLVKDATHVMHNANAESQNLYGSRIARFLELNAHEAKKRQTTPEEFVAVVLTALSDRKPKSRYAVGADAKLNNRVARFLPDTLLDTFFARMLR